MRITLFFCLSLLLFSCGKKRSIVITAKNPVTGQPYAGLSYYVVSSRGNGSRTEASGVLNENGEAAVTLRIKDRSYNVRVVAPENTCYNKNITLSYNYPYDNNHVFTFEFAECATLQRKVKNVNCVNSDDKIEIYIDNSVHSLLTTPWILNGCADYTTVPTQVPVGNYTLHWIVTKNGVSNDYYDSFDLSENEYKLYEINY